jgi:biopolymer transport protein ExbB/TolQ
MDPVGTLSVFMVFMIPLIAIITSHKLSMARLKMQQQTQVNESLRFELDEMKRQIAVMQAQPKLTQMQNAELAELREQMISLRDTSTQYDISIDSYLHNLEARVQHLESTISGRTSTQTAEHPEMMQSNTNSKYPG